MWNVAERGPLATVGAPRQHSEKSVEMKVYRDVDRYILKLEITGEQQSKNFEKRKKQRTENHKKLNTEISAKRGLSFCIYLSGWGAHPWISVNHTTVACLRWFRLLYNNIITGIQSYTIVFVAHACNIQCILYRSCPMKTRNFVTKRNPVIWPITLCLVVGRSALFTGPCNTCCRPCLLRWLRGIKHRLL